MRNLLATVLLGCLLAGSGIGQSGSPTGSSTGAKPSGTDAKPGRQGPAAKVAGSDPPDRGRSNASQPGISPVRFGSNGWPVLSPGASSGPAPAGESLPKRTSSTGATAPAGSNGQRQSGQRQSGERQSGDPPGRGDVLVAASTKEQPLASGMQLDSPLHDVFRATRTPGALRALGGVEVWWRVHIHGTNGEDIGIRTIKHTADCRYAERDRMEYTDSHEDRTFARIGGNVTAQRKGLPWDSMTEDAGAQLHLFGMHLRLPWCFAQGKAYAIMRQSVAERRGELLTRLQLQRRPPPSEQVFGPEHNPKPRDRYELLFEPTTGLPRELVHRFARSSQQRRVLLQDWKDVGGVRMPFRRIYVDEVGRPTTTLEILKIQTRKRCTERDFQLL